MDFDSPNTAGVPAIPYYDGQEKMARQPNMRDRIDLAVQQAEDKLAAVKRAKEIFAAHPELEELLNIMQRNHF